MSEASPKYFLTTPIYYVNARPHIGHAYTTIVADVLARRHRLLGEDVFFLTGTDEHGQKIERSAAAAGIPPQQFADQVSQSFRTLWKRMGITNDAFIRTTEPAHKRGVQQLFTTLQQNGQIELRTYTGQYCVSEEMFVEGPPGTIGPDGRPTETVSEENYFFKLSEYQLPLLNLIESNTLLIEHESRRNEVLSFLRGDINQAVDVTHFKAIWDSPNDSKVSKEEAWQLAWKHGIVKRTSSTKDFPDGTYYIPGALKDLSISRSSFTWGIPVPGDEKHVIYVWLDALANYMTAVGYGDPAREADFQRWWPADLHIVGKEIIRFHCVYWPAFLMALRPADIPEAEWNVKWLPKKIVAHGWLLFEESKMSKSRGNIVRTETILDAFGPLCPPPHSSEVIPSEASQGDAQSRDPRILPKAPQPSKAQQDLFAADILRYFLLREIPFGQDGSFSFDAMITRYNADLANGYGNLVSRTLKMISQNCDGVIPGEDRSDWDGRLWMEHASTKPQSTSNWLLNYNPDLVDQTMLAVISYSTRLIKLEQALYDGTAFNALCAEVQLVISCADGYLSQEKPWTLVKQKAVGYQENISDILYTAAESIRIITALLYPILPFATANVWRQLGLGDIELAAKTGQLNNLQWGGLQPGTKLGPLSPIFPRADVSPDKGLARIMADLEASQAKPLANITTQTDAATPTATEFPVTSLASELVTNPPEHFPSTDPAAASRTTSIPEPAPGTLVAGSHALTTERAAPESGAPSFESHPKGGVSSEARPSSSADASPQITIDDFAKVELRVAKILVAERIPKADKLLRLEVDLGYERRQILSGIAEWYTPEDLLGRRIVVITNLAPRKMRGLESHGMLLAASAGPDAEGKPGKPSLATFPDSDDLPLGSRLK